MKVVLFASSLEEKAVASAATMGTLNASIVSTLCWSLSGHFSRGFPFCMLEKNMRWQVEAYVSLCEPDSSQGNDDG